MKVLAIADTHGNKNTLAIAEKFEKEVDKIIFEGDYTDGYDCKWPEQKAVLEGILDFKHRVNKENPDKVETLFGNHDLCYLTKFGADSHVSGHQIFSAVDIQEFFTNHFEEFKAIVVIGNWIFSHAGVSTQWLQKPLGFFREEVANWTLEDINKAFSEKKLKYFNHNSMDGYGDDPYEGCMWIRPPSLLEFGVPGYHQVVGHTEFSEPFKDNYWRIESDSRTVLPDSIPFLRRKLTVDGSLPNEKCTYTFLDSEDRSYYAIVDTEKDSIVVDKL